MFVFVNVREESIHDMLFSKSPRIMDMFPLTFVQPLLILELLTENKMAQSHQLAPMRLG
jgi:hypothetical protein